MVESHELLQEEKFIKYADGMRNMLENYYKVLSSLDDAEVGNVAKSVFDF